MLGYRPTIKGKTRRTSFGSCARGANAWATPSREYVEHESGGKSADHRKQLAQVFADASRRDFDMLLVWALDRFSREGMAALAMSRPRSSPSMT